MYDQPPLPVDLDSHTLARPEPNPRPALPLALRVAAADVYREAVAKDHRDYFRLVAGQSVGLVNNLPTVAEVMEMIIGETQTVLQEGSFFTRAMACGIDAQRSAQHLA